AARADEADRLPGRRARERQQICRAEHGKDSDRDPGAAHLEPAGRLPMGRGDRDGDADERHDETVAEREEQAAPARAGGTGEAVDCDQMIRIEPVLQAEHEDQRDEAHFWMKSLSHSRVHFSCSSSTVAASTSVYSNWLRCVFTFVLTGTRPIELKSSCPSGESTKSTKACAAGRCGAFLRMAMPCGRATTGCTGSQSIGAPLRLKDSAFELYTVSPTGISPAAISSASSTWPLRTSGRISASLRK